MSAVHPWLHDIVNGECDAESHELQRRLVNFFMDEICGTVNPADLLPSLVADDLLGEMELETLTSITEQKGETWGAIFMVGHLPRSTNRNWYHQFLRLLMRKGYKKLVKKLDDVYYASWCFSLFFLFFFFLGGGGGGLTLYSKHFKQTKNTHTHQNSFFWSTGQTQALNLGMF